jgi:FlaA1/EpsC-like NDP-sugar epimerase
MLPWLLVLRLLGFLVFGQFRGLWRYASLHDLRNIVAAVLSSTLVFFAVEQGIFGQPNYPRTVLLIDSLVLIFLLGTMRMGRRVYHEMRRAPGGKRVLVIGAGNAGEMIVRDMLHNPAYDHVPVGFVDDDPRKVGEQIHGVRVLGTMAQLASIIQKTRPQDVLIAMPSAPRSVVQHVVHSLQSHHVNIVTLPHIWEVASGKVVVEQIRKLSIQDLLARPPIDLDPAPVSALISGRSVMVTGAGGSIGSELCRQIAPFGPRALLLFERYENSLHAIVNELQDGWPGLDVQALVGDVCDAGRVADVFSRLLPSVVFHAAAHKHVPLMEASPCEAVKNNVFGTEQLVDAAARSGVARFILISTDKAVNPTSVMGVSKRIAEMIVQSKNGSSGTIFAVVRFGNVLGSNGSVVPRFLEQIKAGGPVTVTHPEMRRYFMLIPEAVQLVMHAAAMAKGGEVFVLDMGEQMKVLDMARTLIRLSGFVPEEDIPIMFTGVRPGEKLYEELVGTEESAEPSGIAKINRLQRTQPVDPVWLERQLAELRRCTATESVAELQRALQETVSSYTFRRDVVGARDELRPETPTREIGG